MGKFCWLVRIPPRSPTIWIGSYISHSKHFDCIQVVDCTMETCNRSIILVYFIIIWVFPKIGHPQIIHLIGFSNINHPFWGTPIFGNPHIKTPKFRKYIEILTFIMQCLCLLIIRYNRGTRNLQELP